MEDGERQGAHGAACDEEDGHGDEHFAREKRWTLNRRRDDFEAREHALESGVQDYEVPVLARQGEDRARHAPDASAIHGDRFRRRKNDIRLTVYMHT